MTITASMVEIRPATPDQAERAAVLLYSTAAPVFDFLYGGDPAFCMRILAEQWQADESLLSHRHAMGAYDDEGNLLGLELGFDYDAMAVALAGSQAVIRANAEPEQLRRIAAATDQLNYLSPNTPLGEYCVENLAVTDTVKIHGLGRRLLEGAFARAKATGYKAVCLDVLDGNPAFGFYLHLGMHLACEVRLPGLIEQCGLPAVLCMTKAV